MDARLCWFAMLMVTVLSMHINHQQYQAYSQKVELEILMSQQNALERKVAEVSTDLGQLTKRLADTSNDTEKVLLLESSIINQRRQIYNMSIDILPQFNFSRCSCENLTEEQKIGLMRDLDFLRNEIVRLETILNRFPRSERVSQMREDIDKQLFFVNSMKDIIQSKCLRTIIMSPTIFQTNLYAPNWILGNQTASQVVDDYYERSLRYDNVTNCPIDKPFFNGKSCIACSEPRPVFDLMDRKCVSCGEGYSPNNVTKKCDLIPIPVYASNYNDTNYSLDGLSGLPARPADAVGDCPLKNPFFDGKKCIQCIYPTYWSIPNGKCQMCSPDFAYDINTKNCEKIVHNCLTRLEGTQWVTRLDNYHNVFMEREGMLKRNSDISKLCDTSRPFCDSVGCITCPEPHSYFSVDTLKCVAPGRDEVYNANIHAFVKPLKNYQTMVGATFILAPANITDDPSLSKCRKQKPYFDGLSCIKCYAPTNLFDTESRICTNCTPPLLYDRYQLKCTQCTDEQRYNKNTMGCEFISTTLSNYEAENYVNLTDAMSILQEQSIKKLAVNPSAKVCPLQTPFFNNLRCMSCPKDLPLFNHTSKMCVKCLRTEVYNPTARICQVYYPVVSLTNINAGNILGLTSTLEAINIEQQKILSANPKAALCPLETPYAAREGCISCRDPTPLFDYIKKICTSCRENQTYNPKLYRCEETTFLTNLDAANLINLNDTIENLRRNQQTLTETSPRYKICQDPTPYATRTGCIGCSDSATPYFDYSAMKCISCRATETYNSKTYKCESTVMMTNLGAANFVNLTDSMDKLQRDQQLKTQESPRYKTCPMQTPYYNQRSCINCPPQLPLFNYTSKNCVKCLPTEVYSPSTRLCQINYPVVSLTNTSAGNLINLPKSFESIATDIQRILSGNPKASVCPVDTPYAGKDGCISCRDPTPLFDYTTKECTSCKENQVYNPKQYRCEVTVMLTNLKAGNIVNLNDTMENLERNQQSLTDSSPRYKICQQPTPYATREGCISCRDVGAPLFDFTSLRCTACRQNNVYNPKKYRCESRILMTNLSAERIVDLTDTMQNLQKEQQARMDTSPRFKICPDPTPYFNGSECISCNKTEPLFSYKYSKCGSCRRNTWYDKQARKCLKERTFQFLTDLQTKNLILNDTIKNLQQLQDNILQARPTARTCPPETPYSNGPECIACTGSEPLFDYASAACTPCAIGTSYNPDKKSCDKIALPLLSMAFWANKSAGFDPNKKGYVTNTEASNLVNLPKSIEDIRSQYERTMADVKNIEKCPLDKPYSTGYRCISCPSDRPLFNMTSHRCASCQEGQTYNATTYSCTSQDQQEASVGGTGKIRSKKRVNAVATTVTDTSMTDTIFDTTRYVDNLDGYGFIVPEGQSLEQMRKKQDRQIIQNPGIKICPLNKPYYNGKQCIQCSAAGIDTYFDLSSRQCVKCPPGSSYHNDIHQCAAQNTKTETTTTTASTSTSGSVASGTFLTNLNASRWIVTSGNPSTIYNQITQRRKSDSTSHLCPIEKPFVREGQCIRCPPREYFNTDSTQCETCPQGTVFNVNIHNCIQSIGTGQHQTNPNTAPNLVLGGISIAQYESTYNSNKATNSDITDCPTDKPYFDYINCVNCSEPFLYFNMYNRLCQTCGNGSTYNEKSKQCEDSQGRMSTQNPTVEKMLPSVF